jgi:hypothetical protein
MPPRQRVQPPAAPLHFDAPPAPPRREPSSSDQTGPRQQVPPAPQPQAGTDELRLTIGESVDMELVGTLQFRGNIVRVQPLPHGADSQD